MKDIVIMAFVTMNVFLDYYASLCIHHLNLQKKP
jgi:hypothetical protein